MISACNEHVVRVNLSAAVHVCLMIIGSVYSVMLILFIENCVTICYIKNHSFIRHLNLVADTSTIHLLIKFCLGSYQTRM